MKRTVSRLLSGALFTLIGATVGSIAVAQPFSSDETARISFAYGSGSDGLSNADVKNPRMSRNGRFVVFESTATNLVAATQEKSTVILNGKSQVYLFDRQANSLELVSVTNNRINNDFNGLASPVDCFEPSVSNDGRYVAFVADLTDGTNGRGYGKSVFVDYFNQSVGPEKPSSEICEKGNCNDRFHVALFFPGKHILIRDRLANDTMMVSISELTTARQKYENGLAKFDASGRPETVFETMRVANTRYDYVVGDLGYPTPNDIRQRGISDSRRPYVSGDGRFVVYDSDAFTGSGTAQTTSVYTWFENFHFRALDGVVGEDGTKDTDDDYLLPGPTYEDGVEAFDFKEWLDKNQARDIYIRNGGDSPSTQVVSFDCRYHQPKPIRCNIQGTQDSVNASVSDDGQFIAFESKTPFLSLDFNQLPDVYVTQRDKLNQDVINLERISNNLTKIVAPNAASQNSRISANGRFVVYDSAASDILLLTKDGDSSTLVSDTNNKSDVFVFDRTFGRTVRCNGPEGVEGNGDSSSPSVSGAGEAVAFHSNATNWGASGGLNQVYVASTSFDTEFGYIDGCEATLASVGNGSGGDQPSISASVAMVPRSATPTPSVAGTPSTELVRLRVKSVAYESLASNTGVRAPSGTPAADTNGISDIFQAPRCSPIDIATDTDGDGTSDCFDQCYKDYQKVEDDDDDGDAVANCEDNCPQDPTKTQPGVCGCGVPDIDKDGDGTYDCRDQCPGDVFKIAPGLCGCGQSDADTDGDGTPDCTDICLEDRAKVIPGVCGCGNPDTDDSGRPLVGCATPTPGAPTATPTATPVPFESRKPLRPTIKRLTAKKFEATVSSSGLPEMPAQYRLSIEYLRSVRPVSVVRGTSTKIIMSGLRKGRYRVRYQAISRDKKITRYSAYSKAFTVR